jgi:8-oxo-dGTP diphosphatase
MVKISDYIERFIRWIVIWITNFLPVKIIRDDNGVPFLYRYHVYIWGMNGWGICFHNFVKSDPERGYHDHPWKNAVSFILCGRYDERILNDDKITYKEYERNRWTFNWLKGEGVFHRVMIQEGQDAWTFFMFQKRSKTWGMISLDAEYKPMSLTVEDLDGGWWNYVKRGLGLHERLPLKGNVVSTVDIVIISESKVLLIKRGKEPFKNCWAFPGGRIEQSDESIEAAAHRELKEETQLKDIKLKYFTTIGDAKRDPRGFCLTNIFTAHLEKIPKGIRAGDDAVDYQWFPLNELPQMAFDHKQILNNIEGC